MDELFCKECGQKIDTTSKFCSKCGNKVNVQESLDESTKSAKDNTESNKNSTNALTKKRGSNKIAIIIAIPLLIIFAALVFGSSDTLENTNIPSNTNEVSQTSENVPEQKIYKTGEPVRDGKFEMTILSISCGETSIGTNQYLKQDAQGEFCQMSMTVKNIGNEPQTFFSSNQYVYNNNDQKFSNDSTAELAIEGNSDTWLQEINPGNSISGIVVYDVPKGTILTKAELHDSAYSNGVDVKLN